MPRASRLLLAALLACPSAVFCAPKAVVGKVPGGAAPTTAAPAAKPLPSAVSASPAVKPTAVPTALPAAIPSAQSVNAAVAQPGQPAAAPEAAKDLNDKLFDNLGVHAAGSDAVVPQAAGGAGRRQKGPPVPSDEADDGGGPNYPSANVRFWGKLFRTVLFRPNTPVEDEIVRAIDTAKKSIHLALYEFKSTAILDALRRAKERKVEIHIVLDYSNVFPLGGEDFGYKPKRSKEIWALLRENFDVTVLRGMSEYGINHNKFAVIDHDQKSTLSIFGSYNWAFHAEHSHYENAHFDTDKDRAGALLQYWKWLRTMAQPEPVARDFAWPQTLPAPPVQIAETVDFNGVKLPSLVLSPDRTQGRSIEDRLVQAIDASKKTIDVSVFALRSTRIAEALARAHNDPARNVRVRLIMDEGQSTSVPFGPYARWLVSQGVELRVLAGPDPKSEYPLAQKSHHKIAIFDGKLVETGSANFTKYAAAANFENAHFLDRDEVVDAYVWVYERMWKRAKKFVPPSGQAPALPTDAELEAELAKLPKPAPAATTFPAPDPKIQARPIPFRGETFRSYVMRPDSPIEPVAARAIDLAQKSVRLALYEFNLSDVMEALRRAKKRGVKIEIVIDHSHVYTRGLDSKRQPRMPSAHIQELIKEGYDIMTLKGQSSGIMHNKYLLVDAEDASKNEGLAMWGSYNLAETAEHHHFENVQFSNDQHDVGDYKRYFDYLRGLASPIDQDKLDETLNRTGSSPEPEDAGVDTDAFLPEAAARASTDPRDSKFPVPPPSQAPLIDFNGEKFHRRYFSPQGGILDAWLRAIKAAEKSVDLLVFGFYSREVADAIVAKVKEAQASGREFKLRAVFDISQSSRRLPAFDNLSVVEWFEKQGVNVERIGGPDEYGDPMYEKQHNKLMIVDGKMLISGSFNISPTAENNSFENTNLTADPVDVAGYLEYYARIYEEARRRSGVAEAWNKALTGGSTIDLAIFHDWPQWIGDKSLGDRLIDARKARPDLKLRVLLGRDQAQSAKVNGVAVQEWLTKHGFEFAVSEPDAELEEAIEAAGGNFVAVVDNQTTLTASSVRKNAAERVGQVFQRVYSSAKR